MTNEDLRKMVNYYYQLTTFALNMQDEMKTLDEPEWNKVVGQVLQAAKDLNDFLTPHVKDKICL